MVVVWKVESSDVYPGFEFITTIGIVQDEEETLSQHFFARLQKLFLL